MFFLSVFQGNVLKPFLVFENNLRFKCKMDYSKKKKKASKLMSPLTLPFLTAGVITFVLAETQGRLLYHVQEFQSNDYI